MATAGYGMKYGKGYLGGSKEAPMPHESNPVDAGGEEHHEAIRQHLESMHQQTGHAHSHVEHHGDGRHTSHHISADGEHSGPHDHENLEELKNSFDQFANEEEHEGDHEGGEYE